VIERLQTRDRKVFAWTRTWLWAFAVLRRNSGAITMLVEL
jgi:hypothetical protein